MKHSSSAKIISAINEEFYGGSEFSDEKEPSKTAMDLYSAWQDHSGRIEDFANRWNSCTGYPDDVRRMRIKIINPAVVDFVSENAEDLKDNWDEFFDIMEENNEHTASFAIEKELSKYE